MRVSKALTSISLVKYQQKVKTTIKLLEMAVSPIQHVRAIWFLLLLLLKKYFLDVGLQ